MNKCNFFPVLLCLTVIMIGSGLRKVSAQCTETFDGVTAPALPSGWSAVTLADCAGSNPWISTTTTPNSGPNAVYVTAQGLYPM